MITKIFGENCKRARVFDLLLSHPHSEYTKKDISEISEISRTTLDTFIDEIIEFGLIEATKKIGNAQLYRINLNSSITQALNSFQNQLTDIEIEKEVKKYEETHNVEIEIKRPFEEIAKRDLKINTGLWSSTIEKTTEPIRKILEQTTKYEPIHYIFEEINNPPLLMENSTPQREISSLALTND